MLRPSSALRRWLSYSGGALVAAAEPSAEVFCSASNGPRRAQRGCAKCGAKMNCNYSLPFVRYSPTSKTQRLSAWLLASDDATTAPSMRGHDPKYFKTFADAQARAPRIVAVHRAKARLSTRAPKNDLFTIRNIGNQWRTAEARFKYPASGTSRPHVVILGHSGCGAVKAHGADFSQTPPSGTKSRPSIPRAKAQLCRKRRKRGTPAEGEKPKNVDAQSWIDAVAGLNVNHQVADSSRPRRLRARAHRRGTV